MQSCPCGCHGSIWGSEAIAPCILNCGTRGMWAISILKPSCFIPGEGSPGIHLNTKHLYCRAGLDTWKREDLSCPCWEFKQDCGQVIKFQDRCCKKRYAWNKKKMAFLLKVILTSLHFLQLSKSCISYWRCPKEPNLIQQLHSCWCPRCHVTFLW